MLMLVDTAFLGSYAAHYSHQNVWAQNEGALPEGIVVTSEMLYPDRKLEATEFYGDWLRSRSSGRFTHDECVFYGRLLPHLKQGYVLGRRLAAEKLAAAAQTCSAQWAQGLSMDEHAGAERLKRSTVKTHLQDGFPQDKDAQPA